MRCAGPATASSVWGIRNGTPAAVPPWKAPAAISSQPTGLRGRCQAISTPAVAQDSAIAVLVSTKVSRISAKLIPLATAPPRPVIASTSTSTSPNAPAATSVVRGVRPCSSRLFNRTTAWRITVAATGPAAVGAVRLLLPYDTTDGTASVVEKIAANPGRESVVLWLSYLAVLALPVGVLLAGRLAIRTRPVLGAVAAVVSWLGFGSLAASVIIPDYAALAAVTSGAPNKTTVAMLDSLAGQAPTTTATVVFVAGHILGAILLALALRRAIPGWAALALAVSQPLHFIFAVLVPQSRARCGCLVAYRGGAGGRGRRHPTTTATEELAMRMIAEPLFQRVGAAVVFIP